MSPTSLPALVLLGALLLAAAPGEAAAADPLVEMTRYVQSVGDRLTPHQAAVTPFPQTFSVLDVPAVAAGSPRPGVIEITTGLLASLENEAQLANLLAYEQARHTVSRSALRRAGGPSGGDRVARAAAAGAAGAVAGTAARDLTQGSNKYVSAAATGAAVGASVSAVYAFWPRRDGRNAARIDDQAAAEALRVVMAAGYEGKAAMSMWDQALAGSPGGGPVGSYGDRKAARKREKAQRKRYGSLLRPGRPRTGDMRYRTEVLDRLEEL